jgi:hypothetical protein
MNNSSISSKKTKQKFVQLIIDDNELQTIFTSPIEEKNHQYILTNSRIDTRREKRK